jgi:hypothetical protein
MMKNTSYVSYQLRELCASQKIASIFADVDNPDDFIAGYVRGINAKSALVESVTPYGRYDGWFAMRLTCIVEVMHDSLYADRLALLLEIHQQRRSDMFRPCDEDYVVHLLRYAKEAKRIVTVWTATDSYCGFVSALNDLHAVIESLDFMGGQFGHFYVKALDIEMLSLGSEEERMNEALSLHYQAQAEQKPEEDP